MTNAPYHHGDLRNALMEAALVILNRDGESGLQLRDLARAVNVSPAAPYRHFDSRAALLEALAVTGFTRFSRMMEDVATQHSADPSLHMGKAYVNFALANPGLFRLMFSSQLRKDNRPGLRMAADKAFETLKLVTGSDTKSGLISALSAWTRVHGLAVLMLDGQIAARAGDNTEELIAAILGPL